MFDFCFFKAPWTKSELENLPCQGKYYALMAPSYFQKYRSNIQSEVIAWIVGLLRLALWICWRCKHDLSVEKGYWCVVVQALAHADAASSPARCSDQRLTTIELTTHAVALVHRVDAQVPQEGRRLLSHSYMRQEWLKKKQRWNWLHHFWFSSFICYYLLLFSISLKM